MASSPDYARRFGGLERLYGRGTADNKGQHSINIAALAQVLAVRGGKLGFNVKWLIESNINRQVQALGSTLGAAKVLAMQERILAINPSCVVTPIEEFIDERNPPALIPACDAVIDAIDHVRAKAALIAHCRRAGIRIVTTGAAGGRTDPTRIEVIDLARTTQDALASRVRALLRKDYGFPREPKKKFGVDCVYSPEQLRRGASADFCDTDGVAAGIPVDPAAGLNCAGYGSSVAVTAGFGFAAAARVLAGILPA